MRWALLLVDVQADFLSRPGLQPDAAVLTAVIRQWLEFARAAGGLVLHAQTLVSADGHDAMPHWREAGVQSCVLGTPGAEPPPSLQPMPDELCLRKRYFSAFEDERLEAALRADSIDTLVLVGLYTHACVRATATEAYARGLSVWIAQDAVASCEAAHAAHSLAWLDRRLMRCADSQTLQDLLTKAAAQREPDWAHLDPCDARRTLFSVEPLRGVPLRQKIERVEQALRGEQNASDAGQRLDALRHWRDRLYQETARWVERLIVDLGKPRRDAEGECRYGLALLDAVLAALAQDAAAAGLERYRPLGLIGLITPWNNPFAIPISKLAPALGYGNGVLWKPALPATRLSEELFTSLCEAGLGDRLAFLPGDAATGQAMLAHPRLAALSFTGSVRVGQQLARTLGARGVPVQAELGGNNAAIVLKDADLPAVAADLAAAMFSFAGQRCTAIRRVIVEQAVWPIFVAELVRAVTALRVGDPRAAETQLGPLISLKHRDALLAQIDAAVAQGARLLCGGRPPPDEISEGAWLEPTLLAGLSEDSPLWREESFGPVVVLRPARDLAEAVALHNAVDHGLLGVLFSAEAQAQSYFLVRAEAGMLAINQARPPFSATGPFIGWKASGLGPAEHGRWNREVYARVQAVYR